ncbi:HlyD family secretion protein [Sphingobacterium paramultivorum]|uniref:HlyD family secretion protein n=1 Tax=Sphingobacterium paramultivorum TaxID=2886510 RepID=A0A7G5E9Z2_9SPHI|nr:MULTISPECIES: HlyD family secretion protein [Sphingobacterium]QMV70817.1 HlyD family secretion protein [Sphingobacterium paramultivorum]WSO14695.1 HlyD family secretion protein [Sphingobacterium paramultivorum]
MSNSTLSEKEIKRRRKIWIINILSAVVIVVTIIWGILVFFHINESVYTDDAQVDAHITPINSRISGYIKTIRFDEHQKVHKGDTLVIIDDAEYRILLQNAQATLADAKASKTISQSGIAIAGNSTAIANANIDEMRARLDNMELNYRRYESLVKDEAVTQYQFDQVKADYEAMLAKYKALLAQERVSKLNTHESEQKLSINDASLLKAESAIDLAKLNLSYTVITAPYDGVLGRRTIEEGQLVQNGTPLVNIVRDEQKWITANYTESQLKNIALGAKVNIEIDALAGKTFEGEVAAISEATGSKYSAVPVDNSTGNFVKVQQRIPVRINFTASNTQKDLAMLRVGMNAIIRIK